MAKKYLKEDLRAEWEQWREELDQSVSSQEQLDKIKYFLDSDDEEGEVASKVIRFYLDSSIMDILEGWGDNATVAEVTDLINFQLDLAQLFYDHGYNTAARIIKKDLDNFGRNFIEWCTSRS